MVKFNSDLTDVNNKQNPFLKNMLSVYINGKDTGFLGEYNYTDLHFNLGVTPLSLLEHSENGNRLNINTLWLKQFINYYRDKQIKKQDILNYTYAILHHSDNYKKYNLNSKKEFSCLPFFTDFWQWAKWGKTLLELHINYKEVKPYKLDLLYTEAIIKKLKNALSIALEAQDLYLILQSKAKLKADKIKGEIELDEISTLKGIPEEAWEYKLGNRSALECILDQYKEKKYSNSTIVEKFNDLHFVDYKEKVIDILKRVTTVSVETIKIIKEMEAFDKQNT